MPLAIDIEGRPLTGSGGACLGTVERLLYHPTEPRAIGAMVRPPSVMVVLERRRAFLPLSDLTFDDEGAHIAAAKLPSPRDAAASLGVDPDESVIWTGMEVRGPSGTAIGRVSDVDFDAGSGVVARIAIAAGAVADVAHGRFVAFAHQIEGYRDGAIRIGAESGDLPTSGGLARSAAAAAVAAGEAADKAGAAVEAAVIGASGITGRAIRAATDSDAVEKAAGRAGKRMRGAWTGMKDAFRDGLSGDGS